MSALFRVTVKPSDDRFILAEIFYSDALAAARQLNYYARTFGNGQDVAEPRELADQLADGARSVERLVTVELADGRPRSIVGDVVRVRVSRADRPRYVARFSGGNYAPSDGPGDFLTFETVADAAAWLELTYYGRPSTRTLADGRLDSTDMPGVGEGDSLTLYRLPERGYRVEPMAEMASNGELSPSHVLTLSSRGRVRVAR